MDKLMSFASER